MMTKYNRNVEQKMLSIFGVTLEGIVSLWHNAVILIWWGHFDMVKSLLHIMTPLSCVMSFWSDDMSCDIMSCSYDVIVNDDIIVMFDVI